jgi:hypothetical protein
MPRSRRIDPDVEVEETEEEEATAAPVRRRRRTEVEEEKPRRTRTAPVDEDDEDEEDEEEAKPVRRSSRSKKKDEDYDDESGDEESDEESAVIPISRGRAEVAKNRPVSESSLKYFRWDDESQLVKFLDNVPWSYDQHWVKRDGKQSFPCLGKGCPLCAIGVKVSQKIVYPVLNLTPPKGEDYIVQSLEVTPTLDGTLEKYDTDKKTGPLTRLWWSVSRTEGARSSGSRKKYNYSFVPVKDRDLEEDWEIDLGEAEDAVDEAEIPTPKEVLGDWTRSQLQEIADEAMGH